MRVTQRSQQVIGAGSAIGGAALLSVLAWTETAGPAQDLSQGGAGDPARITLSISLVVDVEVARGTVSTLAQAGWLDLDDSSRVVGADGLSLSTGPHRLILDAAPFRTWCAYDSLGIAAALGGDAQVETTCGQCDTPISLTFHAGIPERDGPERLWLANGGADLRGSFCTPTVLLCGEEHGAAWAASQGGRGRLLDLTDGARQGGIDWAGCADAAKRLS